MSKKELPRGGGVVIAPNLTKRTTVLGKNGEVISENVKDPNDNAKKSTDGESPSQEG